LITHISNNQQTTGYNTNPIKKPLPQLQTQSIHTDPKHHMTKWATFTYCAKADRQISKLFKNMRIKVAFPHETQSQTYYSTTHKQISATIAALIKQNA
jgi:hypothetical protein